MGQVISPHAKSINCARVVGYQNNLIVIGGYGTNDRKIADVNILDTTYGPDHSRVTSQH